MRGQRDHGNGSYGRRKRAGRGPPPPLKQTPLTGGGGRGRDLTSAPSPTLNSAFEDIPCNQIVKLLSYPIVESTDPRATGRVATTKSGIQNEIMILSSMSEIFV